MSEWKEENGGEGAEGKTNCSPRSVVGYWEKTLEPDPDTGSNDKGAIGDRKSRV